MPPPEENFDAFVAELHREFASFRLVPKERSPLMRFFFRALGMRWWCPDFMSGYTTVLVSRVYMPTELLGTEAGRRTLRHERVHMRDCFRGGVLPFVLSYLFLLPVGLTCRSLWEMRAYRETLRVEAEETGDVSEATLAHVAQQFTGSAYLYMCPFPGLVQRWLARVRRDVLKEQDHG